MPPRGGRTSCAEKEVRPKLEDKRIISYIGQINDPTSTTALTLVNTVRYPDGSGEFAWVGYIFQLGLKVYHFDEYVQSFVPSFEASCIENCNYWLLEFIEVYENERPIVKNFLTKQL